MPSNDFTVQLDDVREEFNKEFRFVNTKQAIKRKIQQLRQAGQRSSRTSLLEDIYEMLEAFGINFDRNREPSYYNDIISNIEFPSFYELELRVLLALYKKYQQYPSPEKYMKRLVDRMSKNFLDNWDSETLRVRILRQFIKYGNYLQDAGFGGRNAITQYARSVSGNQKLSESSEICEYVDDNIFAFLDNATDEQKDPDGRFGLLRTADDLAAGNFRTGGAAKRGIYFFALAFGMTFNYDGKGDPYSDIVKNLFQDYYTNNLIRYITESYVNAPCEFEAEPSGQGINYKNFAEVVLLYFLAQDNYRPVKKIELASQMIQRLTIRDNSLPHVKNPLGLTAKCKQQICELIQKSQDEFEKFVSENYDCNARNLGIFQLEQEQETALKIYHEILEKTDFSERYGEGVWFTDLKKLKQYANHRKLFGKVINVDYNDESLNDFIKLIEITNNVLKRPLREDLNASEMTRTLLIVAFYYYFTTKNDDSSKAGEFGNFNYLFNTIKTELDSKLNSAGYQPFSNKNIFDVLVVFSAWAYFNY